MVNEHKMCLLQQSTPVVGLLNHATHWGLQDGVSSDPRLHVYPDVQNEKNRASSRCYVPLSAAEKSGPYSLGKLCEDVRRNREPSKTLDQLTGELKSLQCESFTT
jgi:hypothetical protein